MEKSAYSVREEYKYQEHENASIDCYIKNRLLSQIEWYDKKSNDFQKKYKRISILTAALNGLIPIIILASDFGLIVKLAVAAISSATAVLTSIQILNNYKELWVQYRTNCALLKSVLHRFYTSSGEFANRNEDDRFSLLVEMSEKYLTSEFLQWSAMHSTDTENKSSPS